MKKKIIHTYMYTYIYIPSSPSADSAVNPLSQHIIYYLLTIFFKIRVSSP